MNNELILAAVLWQGLKREFEEETYGKVMFFPDDSRVRDAKFVVWLLEKYGVKEQAMEDAEKYVTLNLLRKG
jgi:hypothetical protein